MRTSRWVPFFLSMLLSFISSCSLIVDFDQKAKETDCDDATDNDGDGFVDCDDPDCRKAENCNIVTREICGDGVDNDGDGMIDCSDPECAPQPICQHGMEICDNGEDDDGDGMADCEDDDCRMNPNCSAVPEICGNGMDDDNDGMVDCGDPDCSQEPLCQLPLCNGISQWTGVPDEYYFSEVFQTDNCPPNHVCSIRNDFAEYPQCYPVALGEALQGPLATCGSSSNPPGLNCQEGLMCARSDHSQNYLCLPHCAPGTNHGCPANDPPLLCYVHLEAFAGPGDLTMAHVFLCDRPNCDIFRADESCGTSSTCIPTMDRYGNGNCHPGNSSPVRDWMACNGYNDCRAGWVCEQGSLEPTKTCHPICRLGVDPSCPSINGGIATQCKLRDPRDAWGICDD